MYAIYRMVKFPLTSVNGNVVSPPMVNKIGVISFMGNNYHKLNLDVNLGLDSRDTCVLGKFGFPFVLEVPRNFLVYMSQITTQQIMPSVISKTLVIATVNANHLTVAKVARISELIFQYNIDVLCVQK